MAKRTTVYLPDDAEEVLVQLQKKTNKSASWLVAHALILGEKQVLRQSEKHDKTVMSSAKLLLKANAMLTKARRMRRKG